jgi:3',5'-nucleoside bisphosphate phosphatase
MESSMRVDLHSHSNASDGVLDPGKVWAMAIASELDYFALTDHDTIQGYRELLALKGINQPSNSSTKLISGVEVSSSHPAGSIHIVGLNFNPDNPRLNNLLEDNSIIRKKRAMLIADKLSFLKVDDLYHKVMMFNQCNEASIGRLHFARFLVSQNYTASIEKAFKKWLGQGKQAYVPASWPCYKKVIDAINHAGGVAVLAHPFQYKFTKQKLYLLLKDFKENGGQAAEYPLNNINKNAHFFKSRVIKELELLCSVGSDFHDPNQRWRAIGNTPAISGALNPVWDLF